MPFDFLQPQFTWALAGLAIPIAIHLLFRRRSHKVDLGTLRFLRLVLTENARRRKLKRWLLLALRLSCVALLAGLFARPFLLARDQAGKGRLVAILIDRSASMQLKERGRRLIDLAVDAARDVIGQSGEKTQIEVAFFDQAARTVGTIVVGSDAGVASGSTTPASAKPAMTPKELSALIKAPAEMHSATNYGTALAWARDRCLNSRHDRKDLYIYTDLQRSGLDWTNVEPVPPDIELHLIDLGRSAVSNVAITVVQLARHIVRPGETVSIQAGVFNASPFPVEKMPIVLTLECGARKHVLRERLSLEPQTTGTMAFEVPALSEGLWRGIVRIETEDDLPFDNQRFVGLLCAPQIKVLLADGDPRDVPQLGETYFLEKSLRLASSDESFSDSPFRPASASLAAGERLPDMSLQRIVVLANVGALSHTDATALAKFVSAGGSLLVFTGDRVDAAGYRAADAAGLCVGEIGGVLRAHELPYRFEHWDETHPLFEPFTDPQHGDLRRLAFSACTRITPSPEAHVVAWFRGEIPALVEKKLGNGKILWFTSACDREWSDWPRSRLYLPFVHQMLGYLAGLTGGGPVRNVLIDSTTTLAADAVPGVFDRDGFSEVVNTGARESETDRCTPDEFANRFQMTLDEKDMTREVRTQSAALALSGDLRDNEIWHWVAFILIAFLLVEGFVANRTAA